MQIGKQTPSRWANELERTNKLANQRFTNERLKVFRARSLRNRISSKTQITKHAMCFYENAQNSQRGQRLTVYKLSWSVLRVFTKMNGQVRSWYRHYFSKINYSGFLSALTAKQIKFSCAYGRYISSVPVYLQTPQFVKHCLKLAFRQANAKMAMYPLLIFRKVNFTWKVPVGQNRNILFS